MDASRQHSRPQSVLSVGESSGDEAADDLRNLTSRASQNDSISKLSHIQAADSGRKRLAIDIKLCSAGVASIVLMVLENAFVWYLGSTMVLYPSLNNNGEIRIPNDDYPMWVFHAVSISRGTIAALTIYSVVLLSEYYALLLKDKRAEWSRDLLNRHNVIQAIVQAKATMKKKRKSYSFVYSSLFPKFLLEVVVHLLFPYPWSTSKSLTFYHILQMGMFLRLYLVFRLLHTNSAAFKKRFNIRRFYEEFRRMNWQVKWTLSLKILFYEHSISMVLVFLGITMFIGSFSLFVVERKSPNDNGDYDFSQLANCSWFTFVTFFTIGYGDMTPRTIVGRFVTVIIALLGQIILAIFGGVVTNKLVPTKQQQLIESYLKTESGEKGYTEAAASLIQAVWRTVHHRTSTPFGGGVLERARHGVGTGYRQHKQNKIYAAVKSFKQRRCALVKAQLQANDPVVDSKLDKLTSDVEELSTMMSEVLRRLSDGDSRTSVGGSLLEPGLRLGSGSALTRSSHTAPRTLSRNSLLTQRKKSTGGGGGGGSSGRLGSLGAEDVLSKSGESSELRHQDSAVGFGSASGLVGLGGSGVVSSMDPVRSPRSPSAGTLSSPLLDDGVIPPSRLQELPRGHSFPGNGGSGNMPSPSSKGEASPSSSLQKRKGRTNSRVSFVGHSNEAARPTALLPPSTSPRAGSGGGGGLGTPPSPAVEQQSGGGGGGEADRAPRRVAGSVIQSANPIRAYALSALKGPASPSGGGGVLVGGGGGGGGSGGGSTPLSTSPGVFPQQPSPTGAALQQAAWRNGPVSPTGHHPLLASPQTPMIVAKGGGGVSMASAIANDPCL